MHPSPAFGDGLKMKALSFTGVEQDDGFEADELLGLESEHAETGGGGQEHVEDLRHAFHAVAFTPARHKQTLRQRLILEVTNSDLE